MSINETINKCRTSLGNIYGDMFGYLADRRSGIKQTPENTFIFLSYFGNTDTSKLMTQIPP
jgi:hypothetical protein